MHHYNKNLKQTARQLRKNPTESERKLWSKIRNKQIMGIQFYRQKPIENFIVDFYAPGAKLVIEVDGSQHRESAHSEKDKDRDNALAGMGLKVLRFHSNEVLTDTDSVIEKIYQVVRERLENMKT